MRTYFVTGGTGFVGRALVRELLKREDTGRILLLTRNAQARYEMLAWDKRIQLYEGDILTTALPTDEFTDIIHGANEANDLLQPDRAHYYYTIVEGTRRLMEWARLTQDARILLMSSGAVFKGDTVYCRAKRMAESLSPEAKIARIYSVIGEELPLNGQYALGKFFGMALQGQVQYYDAGYTRSYLHVEDCARWLLAILQYGGRGPYDVGSLDGIGMADLALKVAMEMGVEAVPVEPFGVHVTAQNYLPSNAHMLLGCKETISLDDSIRRISAHLLRANMEQSRAA